MRRFIEMADHIRNYGVVGQSGSGEVDKQESQKYLSELLEQCRNFVFSSNVTIPQNPDLEDFKHQPRVTMDEVCKNHADIDAPFTVFSIEVAGDQPLATYKYDIGGEASYHEQLCLLVHEMFPKTYVFLSYEIGDQGARVLVSITDVTITNFYLNRLAKEKMGLEAVRQKLKIGSGKDKRVHTIRQVIHVRPKAETTHSTGSREIDWSHRFEVRGHWRKTDGIGKDRAGNYSVSGYTWVSEHVRGPEHLPLVKKTRLVED